MQAIAEISLLLQTLCHIRISRPGVVTIQKGIENQMNESEKAVVSFFKKPISQVVPPALQALFSAKNISERIA